MTVITVRTSPGSIDIAGDLARKRKAVPSAVVRALTATANTAVDGLRAEMRRVFDRPTPFTLRAVRRQPATDDRPVARVFVVDDGNYGSGGRNFLFPQIEGGSRRHKAFERALQRIGVLPGGWFVVPGREARLDAFGNWQRGQIVQLLSYFQAFGEQGFRANTTAERRAKLKRGTRRRYGVEYFAVLPGRRASQWLHPGIYQKLHVTAGVRAINAIAIFVPSNNYRARFDFYGVAERIARAQFPVQLSRRLGAELGL